MAHVWCADYTVGTGEIKSTVCPCRAYAQNGGDRKKQMDPPMTI